MVLRSPASGDAAAVSHVALSAAGADGHCWVYVHSGRAQEFLREIRYAVAIVIVGLAIYFVRSWRRGEWPFGRPATREAGNQVAC